MKGFAVGGIVVVVAAGYAALQALEPDRSAFISTCESLYTYQCMSLEVQDYGTREDAAANASFVPAWPGYVPEGFEPFLILHTRPTGTREYVNSESFRRNCPDCDPRLVHNDQIGVYYKNDRGQLLVIVQGSPAYLSFHQSRADEQEGTVIIDSTEATWISGSPFPSGWQYQDQIALFWDVGRIEIGSEIVSPGVEYLVGSPFSYSIASNGLSLEELIRIAESVSFE